MVQRFTKAPTRDATRYLVASEYVAPAVNGRCDRYTAAARWEFIKALSRTVPRFFDQLRDQVYTKFTQADRGEPALASWGREFHVDAAAWIMEGARATLSKWHRLQSAKTQLDYLGGFRTLVVEDGMTGASYGEREFKFSDPGWDPLLIKFDGWHRSVLDRIEIELKAYEQRVRGIAEERRLKKVPICSNDHFEWLALFQCGNFSLDSIRALYPLVGGTDTISKGMHSAADLIGLTVRTNRPIRHNLKSR
jgi:hypothetical protein